MRVLPIRAKVCCSPFIQNGYLHTKTKYLFNHLSSFNFGLLLLPIFLLPRSAPARGKRDFVLVACYACASDGQWPAFAGRKKLFPFSRGSPSSVGDIDSPSGLRQPQLVLLSPATNFINFTNFQLSTDTCPHFGRTSPLHGKGDTTAKAARWILSEVEVGYRKKRGKRTRPSPTSPHGFCSYGASMTANRRQGRELWRCFSKKETFQDTKA
jgi:hypothetical protein